MFNEHPVIQGGMQYVGYGNGFGCFHAGGLGILTGLTQSR